MKIVVFGLSVTSSWGNGHAALWRGLAGALDGMGHELVFFEKDAPHYAAHRDAAAVPGCRVVVYPSWESTQFAVRRAIAEADAVIVTSHCPDGARASELVLDGARCARVYYDLDTPATLLRLDAGEPIPYLPPEGLKRFDLVLASTGGHTLHELARRLGARHTAALHPSVDTRVHAPAEPQERFRADLSCLGTYAQDRAAKLAELFVEPARRMPERSFVIAGAMYPPHAGFPDNVRYLEHLAPAAHAAFFSSSRLTLNATRGATARWGHCPSARLFEAAASGAPIVSDDWDGIADFFEPHREILVVRSAEEVMEAIARPDEELRAMAARARRRVLAEHTSDHRARELVALLAGANRFTARAVAAQTRRG